MTNLLLFLLIVAVIAANLQLKKLIMTITEAFQAFSEVNVKLDDISAKLIEGFTEITDLIGRLQNTELTSEQVTIVTALQSKVETIQPEAQSIADIVPGPQTDADRDTK